MLKTIVYLFIAMSAAVPLNLVALYYLGVESPDVPYILMVTYPATYVALYLALLVWDYRRYG